MFVLIPKDASMMQSLRHLLFCFSSFYVNGTCPISVLVFACQAHFRELMQFDECAQMIFFGGGWSYLKSDAFGTGDEIAWRNNAKDLCQFFVSCP